MHSLAVALRVTPMATYHYFPGRDELLTRVADDVMRDIHAPDPASGTWDERLWLPAAAALRPMDPGQPVVEQGPEEGNLVVTAMASDDFGGEIVDLRRARGRDCTAYEPTCTPCSSGPSRRP